MDDKIQLFHSSDSNRSVSGICGAEHESGSGKGLSHQNFTFKYVCVSFMKDLYLSFYSPFNVVAGDPFYSVNLPKSKHLYYSVGSSGLAVHRRFTA